MSTSSNPFSVSGSGVHSSVPRTRSPVGTTPAPGFFGSVATNPGVPSGISFPLTPASSQTETERLRGINARLTAQIGQEGELMREMNRMHDEFDSRLNEYRVDANEAEARAIRAERHLADLEDYCKSIAAVRGPTANNAQAMSGPKPQPPGPRAKLNLLPHRCCSRQNRTSTDGELFRHLPPYKSFPTPIRLLLAQFLTP